MQTSSRWSEILAAITVLDVELTAEIFLIAAVNHWVGLWGYFIVTSTLKWRPEAAGISGAEVDQSLRWEDLAVPASQLSCVHVQGVTHCSPGSGLQLPSAAHYPKIPGACKAGIPSKTRDLVIGSQLHTSPHQQLP